MLSIFEQTINRLNALAEVNDKILISFSGGKDSLIVLDLCSKTFKKVTCFFMYLIPGLGHIERQLQCAEKKYGVEILQYPHWLLSRLLKNGIYCNNHHCFDNLPALSPNDIYSIARYETGINLIATGQKKSDNLFRRRNLLNADNILDLIHPLKDWNKYDVLSYMRIHDILLPQTYKGQVTGADLTTKSLLWLYDTYPKDFRKLTRIFPYARTVVYRRKWYDIEK